MKYKNRVKRLEARIASYEKTRKTLSDKQIRGFHKPGSKNK